MTRSDLTRIGAQGPDVVENIKAFNRLTEEAKERVWEERG
jgi:hypothetical protein